MTDGGNGQKGSPGSVGMSSAAALARQREWSDRLQNNPPSKERGLIVWFPDRNELELERHKLFLLDRGDADLVLESDSRSPLSFEQAWRQLLPSNREVLLFHVYSHLKRIGLVVKSAAERAETTDAIQRSAGDFIAWRPDGTGDGGGKRKAPSSRTWSVVVTAEDKPLPSAEHVLQLACRCQPSELAFAVVDSQARVLLYSAKQFEID